jgi:hypothetical protein
MLRNGRRIGRRNVACPASGVARVRVRITAATARRLRAGIPVRVKVRTGAQQHSKRMRVVRAVRRPSDGAVGSALAHASEGESCSAWYVTSNVAFYWQTSTSWWEFYCYGQGFAAGGHLGEWWHLYFWTGSNQEYYGTWTHYYADGCWYYWHATNLSAYGPWC